jgi:LuxR family maltose regulon positive regulatory protein
MTPLTQTFALTKIQPPRLRTHLIARPWLERRLADALATTPLTLVCAPAGFGKTAAVTRQLALLEAGTAVAWIAADEDDDLARICACLVAALEPFDLPWRTSPDALVAAQDGGRAARQAFAFELLNALASAEAARGLIVLDDMHRVTDPAVFEFLDTLLERLPASWGLLIASRVDPPLALARLRVRNELAEFRQDDLGFSPDEVGDLVRERKLHWSDAQVRQLVERTQGWPAGLGLVLSQGGSASAAPAGSMRERQVFDYLVTEVLDDLDPVLREFLLRCSVLPELVASRCASVSGQPQAAALLEEIERRGLFASVRGEQNGETVLCLHDLFRDCLEDRLRLEMPGEVPQLLQRAAQTEPDLVRRIGYLARSGHWADAELALYEAAPGLIARGAVVPTLRLIEQFPASMRGQSAKLLHVRGLCAWAHWDLTAMCQSLERAAQGHRALGDAAAAQRAAILVVLGLAAGGAMERSSALLASLDSDGLDPHTQAIAWQARSWHALAASRPDGVAEALSRMMDLLERSSDAALWLQCVPLTSFVGLPGTSAPIRRYIDGALRLTPAEPPSPMRVLAQALQAGLWLGQGEVERAAELLQRVDDDCRWLNRPPNLNGYLHLFLGLAHAVLGHRDKAFAAADARLAGLDDERTSGRRATWLGHFYYAKARAAVILDDTAAQPELREMATLLQAPRHAGDVAFFLRERLPLPAHLAAAEGRWSAAAAGYGAALQEEAGIDLYGQGLETRVRLAHACVKLGRRVEAADALGPVFARAASTGDVGAVLFAGPNALTALAAADWGDVLGPAQVRMLKEWSARIRSLRGTIAPAMAEAAMPAAAAVAPAAVSAIRDPLAQLSSREAEVLERIAGGDSNKLIARAFDISPHTVKRHVANILDKLGVSSRGQAAAWHRQRAGE